MDKSVRTVIGDKLQTAQKLNRPYTFSPNSVMNKELGVFPDDLPSETPWTQYAAVGIGGLSARFIGDNRRLELFPIPHQATHTGMYEQIPFVIRPVTDPLTEAERLNFRLRRVMDIKGVRCEMWYLRRLDLSETVVQMEYRTIQDGVVISDPWEPTANDQRPKPWVVNPGQVLVTGDDYVASSAKSTFRFSPWDITELLNVGKMLFDSETAITVSELALCSGVDARKRADFNGANLEYTEALGVQINDFVSTLLPAAYNRAGASINLDIGAVEPLLALKTAS